MAKAFTPSAVAWLLVLAAVLWFGGNYLMDRIYEKQVKTLIAGQYVPTAAQWAQARKETDEFCSRSGVNC